MFRYDATQARQQPYKLPGFTHIRPDYDKYQCARISLRHEMPRCYYKPLQQTIAQKANTDFIVQMAPVLQSCYISALVSDDHPYEMLISDINFCMIDLSATIANVNRLDEIYAANA